LPKTLRCSTFGFFSIPNFYLSIVFQVISRIPIFQVGSCPHYFYPQAMGYVFVMKYAPKHFNQSSVMPFNNTIGLWPTWWSELLLNAFHFVMTLESFKNELIVIVTPNGLNFLPLPSFHHSLEFFKCYQRF
jgi:hypothetical protein